MWHCSIDINSLLLERFPSITVRSSRASIVQCKIAPYMGASPRSCDTESRRCAAEKEEVDHDKANFTSGDALWPTEAGVRDHLLRLTGTAGASACPLRSDAIETTPAVWPSTQRRYGHIADGHVRAAAELRRLGDAWGEEAEAAFSVEKAFQDQGVGSELMGRIVRAARNRGIRRLYMSCLAENSKMQTIARKYEAELKFEYGEVIGEILPETPNYFSIMAEAAEDRVGFMIAVLELQSRLVRAA
jgi:GNAT superfamily N-acetyltransferase